MSVYYFWNLPDFYHYYSRKHIPLGTCLDCGTLNDRDENASVNLRKEGIRILKEEKQITIIHDDKTTVGTTGSHAFGDDVRPQEILQDLFGQFSRKKESITLYLGCGSSKMVGL